MPDALDNPAARLAAFLRAIPERGRDRTVGEVLGVTADANEPFDVALRMIEIRRLAQNTRTAVEALPPEEDPALLLQHFSEVESFVLAMASMAFSSARIRPADSFNARFGVRRLAGDVMFSLDICAKALHRCSPEPYLAPEQLTNLIGRTRSLIDEVVLSERLTPGAKAFLVERLREIETALLGAQITGYANLEDAVDRLTGGLLRREDAREKGIMERITAFVKQLVQAAQGTSAIAGATASTVQAIETISHSVSS
ncbi:hypothetical protein [Krasilnikovia sp. MM14-A1004]|uniref:hypothetical protein n=1 Tax=Krasilnikovia sp. MM14-A1004 TaxID=3373541 RepID=UPI00399C8704